MFCLKQVPGGHWSRWEGRTRFLGFGAGSGLVGLPPSPVGPCKKEYVKVSLGQVFYKTVYNKMIFLLLTTSQTLCNGVPQKVCFLNLCQSIIHNVRIRSFQVVWKF